MTLSGSINIHAVALDPIHHGAGTEGNTVVLRRQEICLPDGTIEAVPFVSGNSIRHMLRNAGVLYALEAMGVAHDSLSKGVVDLLFSGGSLGGKNSLTLAQAKRIEEMFPILSVLGYSAGNTIASGRIDVHHLHLVCEENAFRAPAALSDNPRWSVPASANVSTEFGTRHDAARSAAASRFLALKAPVELGAPTKKGKPEKESTQMIYEFETISAGAEFFGGLVYRGLKPQEMEALESALTYACDGADRGAYLFRVGAKASTGFGRMLWRMDAWAKRLAVAPSDPSKALLPSVSEGGTARLEAYRARLAEHRAAILEELEALAS